MFKKLIKNILIVFVFLSIYLFVYTFNLYSQNFDIQIETDKPVYRLNEPLYMKIILTKKAYLYILTLQSNGNLLVLYPNEDDKSNYLSKGHYRIPSINSNYEFLAHEPKGVDTFIAIASQKEIPRLHKKIYWRKPLTRKPIKNLSNYRWLKKLTKNLMPDEWDYSETTVNIIGNTRNFGDRRIDQTTTKKSNEFSDNVVMNGSFTIPKVARLGENKFGTFIIYKKPSSSKENDYKLRIAPYSGGSSCEYDIKSFSAPNQTTDLYGTINVEPSICKLKDYETKFDGFWKSVTGVYLRYKYDKFGKLDGNIWFTVQKKYNENLNNVKVKDNFNFLLEHGGYRYESKEDKKNPFDKFYKTDELDSEELEYIDSEENLE